ncbi:MAG: lipoate--protein ligase family protein [Candidatus Sumerlaeaceae bacterium]|nr:lipoate--protein ligase family protein [Candidatus Sumerlaeaceae bacterium]
MKLLDLSLPTPEENLALEEALLEAAEAGESGEILRLWESPVFFVVLGAGCRVAEDVNTEACARAGVPILRRCSGGGTVLQGPGCLNYSLVLSLDHRPELKSIAGTNIFVLSRVAAALATLGIAAEQAGISDIITGDMKISGNAQKRKKHHILFHGTLLYSFDLLLVPRFLQEPKRQPGYRDYRRHKDFLTNIDASPRELKTAIEAAFGPELEHQHEVSPVVQNRIPNLIRDRYSNEAWNLSL